MKVHQRPWQEGFAEALGCPVGSVAAAEGLLL